MDERNRATPLPDHAAVWGALKWLAKVLGGAALGGATAAFTAYTTFQGMQTNVQALGATSKIHTAEIEALKQADANQAIVMAVTVATTTTEREANKEQLKQIRQDLQFLQQQLIGRVRR